MCAKEEKNGEKYIFFGIRESIKKYFIDDLLIQAFIFKTLNYNCYFENDTYITKVSDHYKTCT